MIASLVMILIAALVSAGFNLHATYSTDKVRYLLGLVADLVVLGFTLGILIYYLQDIYPIVQGR